MCIRDRFSSDEKKSPENGSGKSKDDLVNDPNRLPFYTQNQVDGSGVVSENFIDDFEKLTSKIKEKSSDEFWQITAAYLSFLKKDYEKSTKTLNQIKTTNPEYVTEITRMKMLNDIVSQPEITSDFEIHLMKDYPDIFEEKPFVSNEENGYAEKIPSTQEFIRDILANRYFLQGEEGKSFLINNFVSDLQYNPNAELVKKVQAFCRKPNKNTLEEKIIAKNIDNVGDLDACLLYTSRCV